MAPAVQPDAYKAHAPNPVFIYCFHRRKMSSHALQKMTRDLFRAMSLAPRHKCPRNVVEMKEAMEGCFGSDSGCNFLPL